MSDVITESDAFSYRSRRWPMSIDVTIAENDIRWCYRFLGNEWREQFPVNTLIPYPTITVSNSSAKLGAFTLVVVPLIAGLVLWWFGANVMSTVVVAGTVAAALSCSMIAFRRGPLEWASFDTYYPDKSIYICRNTGDLDFDAFVDRLRDTIIESGGACGTDCD